MPNLFENVIRVSVKNTSYIRVDCELDGVCHDIYERFSFFADGYRFHPKFKMKVWDGKVRLFNLKDRTLPFGLYPDLLKWAADQNIKVVESCQVMPTVKISDDEIEEFVMDDLKLPFEPRDYQVSSAVEALRIGRRLIISPTGCLDGDTMIDVVVE